MNKSQELLILSIIVILSLSLVSSEHLSQNKSITGKAITGDVIIHHTQLSIQIVGIVPTISLISPRNITYFTKENILLNYTSNNSFNIWYSLNGGANITITTPIHFNVSSNSIYTLRLYSNNSDGNRTLTNITFIANNTKFNVSYSDFNKNDDQTTNFEEYGYEEIQNLTNITINSENLGKINFQEAINLTECSSNLCDLNSNINISFNRIELNSTALPNFNKSAILTLYNLTFTNPRILKDNFPCSSSECAKISYSGGNLTFNVTSFSTYSAEEISSSSESSGSSGSSSSDSDSSSEGSGAGGIVQNPPFTVLPLNIAVNLKKGESKEYELTILNSNRSDISIELSSDLGKIININEKTLNLKKGESRTIKIDFKANQEIKESNYLGNILIKSRILNINIPVSITLSSKDSLFDIKIDIKDNEIISGQELISNLQLHNLGEGEKQVLINYSIKDQKGKIIILENESLLVNKKLDILKKFKTPEDLESGVYLLSAILTYDDKIASTSIWFKIKTRNEELLEKSIKITLVVIIVILLILITFRIKNKKKASKN